MTNKQVQVKSAHYVVDGKNILIPTVCLVCQKKGLVLVYNHEKSRMEAICSAREDEKGQFIKGCDKVSFAIPMTQHEYNIIVDDPHTTDYFFYLKTLS